MAEIQPFCGIRHNTGQLGRDLSSLIAPPYDVLSAADKTALLAENERNIVAVDLPHVPPKTPGPDAAYEAAAERFRQWRTDGTLVQEPAEALYRYHQTFTHDGNSFTRRMMICRLRLERFGEGRVFPHEQTFPGAKADRLKLMQTTRCNLSPIFALYTDPQGQVAHALGEVPGPCDASGLRDGVMNELWAVRDAGIHATVAAQFQDKNIYIADGHHRYETGLAYRDWLVEQNGPLPDDHPAQYILVVLCAMEDPGLLILPTHRLAAVPSDFDLGRFLADVREHYETTVVDGVDDPAGFVAGLHEYGPGAIGLYAAGNKTYHLLKPRGEDVLASLAPDRSEAWRKLGVSALQRYLLGEVLEPKHLGGQKAKVTYVKDAAGTVDAGAGLDNGLAFLVQPIDLAQMRAVCEGGDVMPEKSTYFFPKLATGLVINPLDTDV